MISKKWSDERIAGQRLMVGFDGLEFNDDLKFLIGDLMVGGLILFSRNIETPDQVKALCESCRIYAYEKGLPPLFIAIDQEGGQVARFKPPYFSDFPDGITGMKNKTDVDAFVETTACELSEAGINMNMAPVLDVEPDGFTGIMNKRVFRGSSDFVAEMGSFMISGFQSRGIMAVAKHFPGIGRTTLDSHLHLPVLATELEELMSTDLVPFKEAVRNDVAGIMLSHILYSAIDDFWPASLSDEVVKGLLREEFGYQGVVMTDDLDMKAIRVPVETSVEQIIKADVDIALICHKGPDIEKAVMCFREAGSDANLVSFDRIMRLKKRFFSDVSYL